MAQIGKLNTRSTISLDVGRQPTESLGEAGRVGKSIQQLGSTVSSAAGVVADITARKNIVKLSGRVGDKASEISAMVYEFGKTSETKAAGTDYDKYSENYDAGLKKIMADSLSGESPEVSAGVKHKMQYKLRKMSFNASATEDSGNIKYNVRKRDKNLDNLLDSAYANTDYELMNDEYKADFVDTVEQKQNMLYTEQGAADHLEKLSGLGEMSLKGDIANNMPWLKGMVRLEDKTAAINSLTRGDNADSAEMMKAMNPKSRKELTDRMIKIAENQVLESDNNISKSINDLYSLASSSSPYDPRISRGIRDIGASIPSIQNAEKKALAESRYKTALKIDAVKENIRNMTQSDLDDIQTGAGVLLRDDSNYVSLRQSGEATKQLERMTKSMKNMREKDVVTEVYKTRPDLIGHPDATLKHAIDLGVVNARAITDTKASLASADIQEGINSKEKFNFMMTEMAKYTENGTKVNVMQHMIDEGGLPKHYMYAARVSDSSNLARNIIRLGAAKEEINEKFKTSLGGVSPFNQSFGRILGEKLQAFSGKSDGLGDSISVTVMTRAKEMMVKETSLDADKAIRDSWDEIVTGQMSIIEIRSGSVAALAVTPEVAEDIRNFDDISNSEYLFNNLDIELQPADYEFDRETYLAEIADNGIWQADKSGDGLELVYPQDDGFRPIKDSNGAPINVKFSNMNTWVIGEDLEKDVKSIKGSEALSRKNLGFRFGRNQ